MSDDLDKKIQQIAEMLGQDKVPDNIKSLVSLLAGSMSNKEGGTEKAADPEDEQPEEEKTAPAEAGDGEEMMRKVKKAMGELKDNNDPRINLLHAIRPFMSGKRQKKISNAIQLLQISGVAKLLNNDK